jgi:hypothetical protein
MAQRRRVKLSANQRMDMWGRWKAGQSLHEIGRAFGKSHVVVHFLLTRHGGIAPAASALAAHAYTGGARGYLPRDRRRIVDSSNRQGSATSGVDGEPGGGPPWRAAAVSSQRCRSASLGVGLAAQDLGLCFPSISERKVEIFLNVENNRTLYSSTTYAPPC